VRPCSNSHTRYSKFRNQPVVDARQASELDPWSRLNNAAHCRARGKQVKRTGVRFGTVAALALAGLLQQGCATIFHGKSQTINVTSDPPGSLVAVGGNTFVTPAQVTLRRDSDYTLVAKKPGYEGTGSIEHSVDWYTFLGNIIFGGLIGWAIDFSSGSAYELSPETVAIQMVPVQTLSSPTYGDTSRQAAPPPRALAAPPEPQPKVSQPPPVVNPNVETNRPPSFENF